MLEKKVLWKSQEIHSVGFTILLQGALLALHHFSTR